MKIITILGTRPEIIRLSLILKKIRQAGIKNTIFYTGQNYDSDLSNIFFRELKVKPDYFWNVKSKLVGKQIAKILENTEKAILKEKPEYLLVLGDTNSALSAIIAARYNIPVIHLEAGNRCHDWRVPEEKNRVIIDHISTYLLPYTVGSKNNLLKEGIDEKFIFVCGNPILEVLNFCSKFIEKSLILNQFNLKPNGYFLLTLHREENVDDPKIFSTIIKGLNLIGSEYKKPIIWSVHPRTRKRLKKIKIQLNKNIILHEPFDLFDFIKLEKNALGVLTDSGTVQEECSLFHIPTVTTRNTTERPETVECGSNLLSGTSNAENKFKTVKIMLKRPKNWISPYEKDTNVSEKVLKFIISNKNNK